MRRIQIARNTLHNGKIWQSYLENLFGLQSSENLFSGVWFLRCVQNKGRREGSYFKGCFFCWECTFGCVADLHLSGSFNEQCTILWMLKCLEMFRCFFLFVWFFLSMHFHWGMWNCLI